MSEQKAFLALYFDAPMQSWGYQSRFDRRTTLGYPTRSGVFGMLCAAMGIDWGETAVALARLQDIEMTVLVFELGGRLWDYHTVGGGYDKKTQEDVLRAHSELHDLGPSAFPYLFEHFADERYSLTADRGSAYDNFTVGDVCYDIVADQLQPYGVLTEGEGADARRRPSRPDYPRHIRLRDLKTAQTWWELHKKMTLREIQMEALQWVIDEEAKAPTRYSDSERRWLAETLESLRKSDKPLE